MLEIILYQIFQDMLDYLLNFHVAVEKSNAILLLQLLIIDYFFSLEILESFLCPYSGIS
jgi:hypothetical protein